MFPEINDIPQKVHGIPIPFKSEPTRCDSFMLPLFPSLSQFLHSQLSSFGHRSQHPVLIIIRTIMTKAHCILRSGGKEEGHQREAPFMVMLLC